MFETRCCRQDDRSGRVVTSWFQWKASLAWYLPWMQSDSHFIYIVDCGYAVSSLCHVCIQTHRFVYVVVAGIPRRNSWHYIYTSAVTKNAGTVCLHSSEIGFSTTIMCFDTLSLFVARLARKLFRYCLCLRQGAAGHMTVVAVWSLHVFHEKQVWHGIYQSDSHFI